MLPIIIASNFTAAPVHDALAYWLRLLDIEPRISFAPYDQVLQEIWHPASAMSTNDDGVNVVLVRPYGEQPSAAIDEIANAIDARVRDSGGRWIVVCCPPPPPVEPSLEQRMSDGLARTPGTHVIASSDILRRYAIDEYDDAHGATLGDMPYTPAFFAAIGTAVARAVHAMVTPPRKVLVLDCDNTLWSGICGEDGVHGVVIDEARRHLQQFAIDAWERGVLLCVCSRNEEADVWRVFDERPDMRLRREHLVAWRINWQSKSTNLRALADELQLGLDAFVYLDDDPAACADVRWHLPEVVTLQLPEVAAEMSGWLDRLWVFDRSSTTDEDRDRTRQYRLNRERDSRRADAATPEQFAALLDVRVRIEPARPAQAARLAQLTARTTQFNCTLNRRSDSDIARLCAARDHVVLAVHVADRYGDYGLVGVIIARLDESGETLTVDTFLLSCRSLGRNVEPEMVRAIETVARERGCTTIRLTFVPGPRNTVAREFLDGLGPAWRPVSSAYLRSLAPESVTP